MYCCIINPTAHLLRTLTSVIDTHLLKIISSSSSIIRISYLNFKCIIAHTYKVLFKMSFLHNNAELDSELESLARYI